MSYLRIALAPKQPTYPPDHKPALEVPKGGSSCATCQFYKGNQKCGSPDYAKFYGTDHIPLPPDRFCSDWWEAAPGVLGGKHAP